MWRDWVIDAFNHNMPYDQFIVEQLAGDLLPNPSVQQKLATGFNRNHVLTTEGGIIEEEYRVEYVADRVHTTSTVFLGLSLQCARCHDHKFDPITQRDYYSFFAFFNNIGEKTVEYNQARVSEPYLKIPTKEQQTELDKLLASKKKLEMQQAERVKNIQPDLANWEREVVSAKKDQLAPAHLLHYFRLDEGSGNVISDGLDSSRKGTVQGKPVWKPGKFGPALEFDDKTFIALWDAGAFEHNDTFTLSAWIFPTSNEPSTILAKMDDADASRGYDLILEQGKLASHLIHHWPDNGLKVICKDAMPLNAWHHVALTYDGSSHAAGVQIFVDGKQQKVQIANDKLNGKSTIKTNKPPHIGRRSGSAPFRGKISDVQLYKKALTPQEVAGLAQGQSLAAVADILRIAAAHRSQAQQAALQRYYLNSVDEPSNTIAQELEKIEKQMTSLQKSFPTTMIMQEMPAPRQAFVLKRGQYDQRGEPVTPNVPANFPRLPVGLPANRLALAKWLVEPSHPLTARVAVNHWWYILFGTGIVETVEDFGSQGAWPSHPELMDWLATELVQTKWNVKEMLRLMVTSATYRQTSKVTSQLQERDPKNRLLARGPRFRLAAETIRDDALAMSGLLKERIGGQSVMPYQPDGLWQDVSVERRAVYKQDTGESLYRRSMYTFWKRTCPPPGMVTFDAPDRETCTLRRARTNTPLQALVLMNDPTYLEAARKLAERVLKSADKDEGRLARLYRLAVCRDPLPAEQAVLLTLLKKSRERFQHSPDPADKLLAVGASARDQTLDQRELAAWTIVCSLVLNLDETISKE